MVGGSFVCILHDYTDRTLRKASLLEVARVYSDSKSMVIDMFYPTIKSGRLVTKNGSASM